MKFIESLNKYKDKLLALYGLLRKYEKERSDLRIKCDALKELIKQVELMNDFDSNRDKENRHSNAVLFLEDIDMDILQTQEQALGDKYDKGES